MYLIFWIFYFIKFAQFKKNKTFNLCGKPQDFSSCVKNEREKNCRWSYRTIISPSIFYLYRMKKCKKIKYYEIIVEEMHEFK